MSDTQPTTIVVGNNVEYYKGHGVVWLSNEHAQVRFEIVAVDHSPGCTTLTVRRPRWYRRVWRWVVRRIAKP